MPELLAVMAVAALVILAGVGPLREGLGRARIRSAARELGLAFAAARWRAASRGVQIGMRFEAQPDGWQVVPYRDGDGDGIRSDDIAVGRDVTDGRPYRPGEGRGGVRFGIPTTGRIPRVPPSTGWLEPGGDPVRFGSSDICSFSPLGDATPGTAYLTDTEGRLAAVIVYGATARVRVVDFDPATGAWRP